MSDPTESESNATSQQKNEDEVIRLPKPPLSTKHAKWSQDEELKIKTRSPKLYEFI